MQEIRAGRVDAGLLTLPVEESDLVTVPVLREELLLVTTPTHPLAKTPESGAAGSGRPAVRPVRAGSATRRVIDHFFATEKIEPTDRDGHRERRDHQGDGQDRAGHRHRAVPGDRARGAGAGSSSAPASRGTSCVRETGWVYARANRVPRMIHELLTAFEAIRGRAPPAPPPTRRGRNAPMTE